MRRAALFYFWQISFLAGLIEDSWVPIPPVFSLFRFTQYTENNMATGERVRVQKQTMSSCYENLFNPVDPLKATQGLPRVSGPHLEKSCCRQSSMTEKATVGVMIKQCMRPGTGNNLVPEGRSQRIYNRRKNKIKIELTECKQ